jgi:hypothetical protein
MNTQMKDIRRYQKALFYNNDESMINFQHISTKDFSMMRASEMTMIKSLKSMRDQNKSKNDSVTGRNMSTFQLGNHHDTN